MGTTPFGRFSCLLPLSEAAGSLALVLAIAVLSWRWTFQALLLAASTMFSLAT